jgi:uncharacterized protein (DUF2141 family)
MTRMKIPALFLALLAGASTALPTAAAPAAPMQGNACQGPPTETILYVNVQGLRSGKGLVAVTLYPDDKSRFLAKKQSIYVARVDAHAPNTRVCMHLPRQGVYAIAVYHDEDGNRHLNRSFVGLPQEGFGFSNNPKTFMSLPAFSAVRLNVGKANSETNITLRYP